MNNVAVSGLRYCDIENLIEKIASRKSSKYKNISYFEKEDIAQEIRMKCLDVIKKYNPNRSKNLLGLLYISADNRIKDIKRSLLYNPNNKKKYKKDKLGSSLVTNINEQTLYDDSFEDKIYQSDFFDYIESNLPSGLLSSYVAFRDSNFNPKSLRRKERTRLFGYLVFVTLDFMERSYE